MLRLVRPISVDSICCTLCDYFCVFSRLWIFTRITLRTRWIRWSFVVSHARSVWVLWYVCVWWDCCQTRSREKVNYIYSLFSGLFINLIKKFQKKLEFHWSHTFCWPFLQLPLWVYRTHPFRFLTTQLKSCSNRVN